MTARPWAVLVCAVTAMFVIAGCSASGGAALGDTPSAASGPAFADVEPDEIAIGVVTDGDALPLVVADRGGLFADAGVTVAITRFESAEARDSALAAGEIDALVGDLGAAAGLEAAGVPVAIVSLLADPAGAQETTSTPGLSGERAYLVVSDHYIALPAGLLAARAVLTASDAAVVRIQADPVAHQATLVEIVGAEASIAGGAYRPSVAPGVSEVQEMLTALSSARPDIAQVSAEDLVLAIGR